MGSHDFPLPDAPTPKPSPKTRPRVLTEDTLNDTFKRSKSTTETPRSLKETSKDIPVTAMIHTTDNAKIAENKSKPKIKVSVNEEGSKTKESKVKEKESEKTTKEQPPLDRITSINSIEEKPSLEIKSSKSSVKKKKKDESSILARPLSIDNKKVNEELLSEDQKTKDVEKNAEEKKNKEHVRSLKIKKKDNFKQKYRKSNIELELNFLKETEKIIGQVKDKNKAIVPNIVRKNSDGNASPESEVADNIEEAEESDPEETYL